MSTDTATRACVEDRAAEGRTRRENSDFPRGDCASRFQRGFQRLVFLP